MPISITSGSLTTSRLWSNTRLTSDTVAAVSETSYASWVIPHSDSTALHRPCHRWPRHRCRRRRRGRGDERSRASGAATGVGVTTGSGVGTGAGVPAHSTPEGGPLWAAGPSANRRPSGSINQRPRPSIGMTDDGGRRQLGRIGQRHVLDGQACLGRLGRGEAVVRVDRRAVGLADLEVEVRHRAFGVAAVAHVADHLTGPHRAADGQLRRDLPLVTGEAVVGARGVVVDVEVVVVPAVGAGDGDHAARRPDVLVPDPGHRAVDRGQQRLHPHADQVGALVPASAAVTAVAPVVAVLHRAEHREGDRPDDPDVGSCVGRVGVELVVIAGRGLGPPLDRRLRRLARRRAWWAASPTSRPPGAASAPGPESSAWSRPVPVPRPRRASSPAARGPLGGSVVSGGCGACVVGGAGAGSSSAGGGGLGAAGCGAGVASSVGTTGSVPSSALTAAGTAAMPRATVRNASE